MTYVRSKVDCITGEETTVPLTDKEVELLEAQKQRILDRDAEEAAKAVQLEADLAAVTDRAKDDPAFASLLRLIEAKSTP